MLALFASTYLPNVFPDRVTTISTGLTTFSAPVPFQTWVIASITKAACLGVSVFAAARSGTPDRLAAALSALLAIVLFIMFATTPRPDNGSATQQSPASRSAVAVHVTSTGLLSFFRSSKI
jgi:hypothetical protein